MKFVFFFLQGFFDGAMAARTIASASAAAVEDDGGVADGWGDDADLALDDEEKRAGSTGNPESGDEEGGWEVGDDIELPSDLSVAAHGGDDEDKGYFVPPTRGQPPLQGWASHSQLPVDHASAGSYESAFRLLHDQIGVVNFAPFKYVLPKTAHCVSSLMVSYLLSFIDPCLHQHLPNLEHCLPVCLIFLLWQPIHSAIGGKPLQRLKFMDYQR